eukprot:GDKI01023932.1.p1 GENE.GDKI01023932.1~~GDKI01023932.1.p1  ORF type:complete len:409 (+),score=99.98 GDKI01023932.1:19-1245(+)
MAAANKKRKAEEQLKTIDIEDGDTGNSGEGGWQKHQSVFWKDFGAKGSEKIAAFDMDGTLIETKSGDKFPKDKNDWRLFHPTKVQEKLKEYSEKGYKIVILTNQKGISTGKSTAKEITGKIDDIQKAIGIPMQAFIVTQDDYFRKPCIGAWELIETHNSSTKIDINSSVFVGDAAGRPAVGKKKKDFSAGDYKFALNLGLQFYTPEEFFLGSKTENYPKTFDFDPRTLGKETETASPKVCVSESKAQELVLMVGPPGSGKSTTSKRVFGSYVHVNQDTLKSKDKCIKACKDAVAAGKSVVIDNQNKEKATRALYIKIAQEKKIPVRVVYIDVPKDLCFHMNAYRMLNPRVPEHRKQKVPAMIIHSFYKNVEVPNTSEGVSEVITLGLQDFQLSCETKEDEKLMRSFLE